MTYFNPLDKFFKSQIGAVCEGEKLTFRVRGNFNSVVLLLKKDINNVEEIYTLEKINDYFEVNVALSVGLYFYCFSIDNSDFIGLGEDFLGIITDKPERFQLTVYSKEYFVPDWIKGGVIYQIFPDRFCRFDKDKKICANKLLHDNWLDTPIYEPNEYGKVLNNDFFGGDIKGIISKLNYLAELGVTVIYLNPIFKAYSNHRYDTGDYMQIDSLLGDMDDFKLFISKASEYGIKIILDGVFNHTGDDSLYFNKYGNYPTVGAYQSKNSKYYEWYNFIDYPCKYDSWWGITVLPAVNKQNSAYKEFISGENGVIDYYTKMGIGGWRLDVVDELPSDFVRSIRSAAKKVNSDAIIIGEVWEDATNKISYGVRREYFQGQELDSVMNYPLKNAIIDYVRNKNSKGLSRIIKEQLDHYPQEALHSLMNILSTHDTYRLITAVAGENADGKTKTDMANMYIPTSKIDEAKFLLKVASLLQYTLCGVPSLYYGDEIGMQGYADPLNRKCYPWGQEDGELLSWYKFLGEIRRDYDAFKTGDYEQIYNKNGVLIFKRIGETSELAVAINLSSEALIMQFEGNLYNLINNTKNKGNFVLDSNSFAILIKN